MLSRVASYLTRIEQLPSLVTSISVTSNPPGASVSFIIASDDKAERELDTNGTVANLYLGNYTVKIAKEGYRSKELYIKLLDEPLAALLCTLRRTGEPGATTCQQLH